MENYNKEELIPKNLYVTKPTWKGRTSMVKVSKTLLCAGVEVKTFKVKGIEHKR